jgi:hypothetical protein
MGTLRTAVLLTAALAAAPAGAQRVGTGSGSSSRHVERSLWLLSQGGAPTALPAGRGGASPGYSVAPAPEAWRSGDRVRSWTSADVRAARQQQAPDLEWAAPRSEPAAPTALPRRSAQANPENPGTGRKR